VINQRLTILVSCDFSYLSDEHCLISYFLQPYEFAFGIHSSTSYQQCFDLVCFIEDYANFFKKKLFYQDANHSTFQQGCRVYFGLQLQHLMHKNQQNPIHLFLLLQALLLPNLQPLYIFFHYPG
jgi:hypothetical protein